MTEQSRTCACLIDLLFPIQKIHHIGALFLGPCGIYGIERGLVADEQLPHIQRAQL
jgi:hypothetical protein